MTDTIHTWWRALSFRERWLVGVAGVLAFLAIGWFGITMPLLGALDAARERHAVAIDRQAGVAQRVAEIDLLTSSRGTAGNGIARPEAATALSLWIGQSAAEQGFTLSRNEAQGPDRAAIAIGNARAPALIGWVAALEQMGVMAQDLSMRPNRDGTIAITATFGRAS